MNTRRLVVVLSMLIVFVAVIWLQQVMISHAPAQHGGNVRITGKVSDKILKPFDAAGLRGVLSIQYRRFTMSPGATMRGDMVMTDHIKLCVVENGSVTVTYADGSKRTYKQGDIFVEPLGLKETHLAADSQDGFVELYWSINVKGRH